MKSKLLVGEIPVFPFVERTPVDLRAHPENDMFMVYCTDGKPRVCIWGESAFWYAENGNIEVTLNVEYWFRIPELWEIVEQQEEGNG